MTVPTRLSFDDLGGRGPIRRFEGRDHGAQVSFFVAQTPAGVGPRLHRHPYEETFIVQEGGARFTVDGQDVVAGAGEIVIVPADTPHKFVTTAPTRMVTIHPEDHMTQEWLEE